MVQETHWLLAMACEIAACDAPSYAPKVDARSAPASLPLDAVRTPMMVARIPFPTPDAAGPIACFTALLENTMVQAGAPAVAVLADGHTRVFGRLDTTDGDQAGGQGSGDVHLFLPWLPKGRDQASRRARGTMAAAASAAAADTSG